MKATPDTQSLRARDGKLRAALGTCEEKIESLIGKRVFDPDNEELKVQLWKAKQAHRDLEEEVQTSSQLIERAGLFEDDAAQKKALKLKAEASELFVKKSEEVVGLTNEVTEAIHNFVRVLNKHDECVMASIRAKDEAGLLGKHERCENKFMVTIGAALAEALSEAGYHERLQFVRATPAVGYRDGLSLTEIAQRAADRARLKVEAKFSE